MNLQATTADPAHVPVADVQLRHRASDGKNALVKVHQHLLRSCTAVQYITTAFLPACWLPSCQDRSHHLSNKRLTAMVQSCSVLFTRHGYAGGAAVVARGEMSVQAIVHHTVYIALPRKLYHRPTAENSQNFRRYMSKAMHISNYQRCACLYCSLKVYRLGRNHAYPPLICSRDSSFSQDISFRSQRNAGT